MPLAQPEGSTSVLERTGCQETRPHSLNSGSQHRSHALHSRPSRASGSSLPGRQLEPRTLTRRRCWLGRRPGYRGFPDSVSCSPRLQPPAASTSRGPVSPGLTPPEQPAKPTHRDPRLSRLRPTVSRALPPCSREGAIRITSRPASANPSLGHRGDIINRRQ